MIAFVYAVNGPGLFGTCGTRSIENATSSAVSSLPSWNFDALAQLEFPRLVVDRLPRRREARDHLRVGIHLHELVEDVLGDVVVREQVEEMRIDRRDVGGDRDLQFLRRCGNGDQRCAGDRYRDEETVHQ